MENVKDGTCRIKTSGWPKFLYDLVANPYDPKNKDQGLFRGPLLVRVSVSACGCHADSTTVSGIPPHFHRPFILTRQPEKGNKSVKGRDS